MSLLALARAWQQEDLDPTEKLVLLALADHHNESTGLCCPSIETIAKRTNISARSVQRNISELESRGLVRREVRYENGRQRSNEFVLVDEGRHERHPSLSSRGDVGVTGEGDVGVTHNRKIEPVELPSGSSTCAPGGNGRARNVVWDSLVEVFGEPSTTSATRLRGKVCSSLTKAGATPEEVLRRAKSWPRYFDDATLTDTALEKHWDMLGRPPLRATR